MYKPTTSFTVPMQLLIPEWKTIAGVRKKVYPETGELIYGNFRTFGGTETTVNDVYGVESTATIETWYRPDIKSDCVILLLATNERYEILGQPENIEMRNMFLKFKVRLIGGKA